MALQGIIFNNTTNYSDVVFLLQARLSELAVQLSNCGCTETKEAKATKMAMTYLQVAEIDSINGDTLRYNNAVKAAYNELIKLEQ